MTTEILVPEIDFNYVPYGNFFLVKEAIESGGFYPMWITGHSGNGKTKMIQQACAYAGVPNQLIKENFTKRNDLERVVLDYKQKNEIGKKFVRVNFTQETGEDDLMGHKTLVDGNVEFVAGPVKRAAEEGAILLIDEFDLGHVNKIMCMQPVLEGNRFHIKANNSFVTPKFGFNIFATSNTKGRGSEDGRYGGTSILNSAMLDRFPGMIEHDYPSIETEVIILKRYFGYFYQKLGKDTSKIDQTELNNIVNWFGILAQWANSIRVGVEEEVITTRTLINIIQAYAIFQDKSRAIHLACARYDDQVKKDFLTGYAALDKTFEEEYKD